MTGYSQKLFHAFLDRAPKYDLPPWSKHTLGAVGLLRPSIEAVDLQHHGSEKAVTMKGKNLWFCYQVSVGGHSVKTPPQDLSGTSIQFNVPQSKDIATDGGIVKVTTQSHFSKPVKCEVSITVTKEASGLYFRWSFSHYIPVIGISCEIWRSSFQVGIICFPVFNYRGAQYSNQAEVSLQNLRLIPEHIQTIKGTKEIDFVLILSLSCHRWLFEYFQFVCLSDLCIKILTLCVQQTRHVRLLTASDCDASCSMHIRNYWLHTHAFGWTIAHLPKKWLLYTYAKCSSHYSVILSLSIFCMWIQSFDRHTSDHSSRVSDNVNQVTSSDSPDHNYHNNTTRGIRRILTPCGVDLQPW